MRRIRKLITILIIVIFVISIFIVSGCKRDEFVFVRSIEYTTNGAKKIQSSTYTVRYSAIIGISAEEYEASLVEDRINDLTKTYILPADYTMPVDVEGKTAYSVKEEDTQKDKFLKTFNDLVNRWSYTKCHYKETSYYYIYVKVINDTTIVVRDRKGDTTYTVTSYRITYFE